VWDGTDAKDAAITDWCKKVSAQTKTTWRYKRIDQIVFGAGNFLTFTDLLSVATNTPMPQLLALSRSSDQLARPLVTGKSKCINLQLEQLTST